MSQVLKHFAICLFVFFAGNITALSENKPAKVERYVFSQVHMGTKFRISLYASNQATANETATAAYKRISDLNAILSDYDEDSEVRRLCETSGSGNAVKVSPPLFTVLQVSQSLAKKSNGQFDVTVGPLVGLWRKARRTKTKPAADQLAAAMKCVGFHKLKLHKPDLVSLAGKGMRIDLGAIAKGYAADQALAVISKAGIKSALIDAGGDIVGSDPPPGKPVWVVAIGFNDEKKGIKRTLIKIANSAVATSGDQFQFVELDGKRYSHIVDPATGLGLTERRNVTVVAKSGMMADGIASAISVMGKPGFKLLDKNSAAFVRNMETGEVVKSEGFTQYEFQLPVRSEP